MPVQPMLDIPFLVCHVMAQDIEVGSMVTPENKKFLRSNL